jgi:uncharacterized protein
VAGAEGTGSAAGRRRKAGAAALLLAAGASGAVPPPPLQIAADCERPSYASDQRVCADPALRALDGQVREAWLALAASGQAQAVPVWIEQQDAWFRRRGRCALSARHAACLHTAYTERAAVLATWRLAATASAAAAAEEWRCTGAPWGEARVRAHRQRAGALVISDAAGQVLAIAVADAARDDWQPFLRFTADGRGLRLQPVDAPGAICVPA